MHRRRQRTVFSQPEFYLLLVAVLTIVWAWAEVVG